MSKKVAQGDIDQRSNASRDWATYKRLLTYVWPMWLSFLIAILGFIIGAASETYFAHLLKDIINAFNSTESNTGYFFALMMLAAVFSRGLGELSGEFFLSRISFQVIHQLRMELFEKLLLLPSRYFDLNSSANLISRITFNVAQLKDTATEALKIVIQDGAKVIAFLGTLLYINWKLTLIFLFIAPVVGLIVGLASRRFRRISERVQSSMSDITHVTSEAVSGYRVIRTFGGTLSERKRFLSTSNTNRRQNIKMVITKVVSTQVIQILVAMALALLVVLLFRVDVRAGMNAGEIVEYLTLAGFLARPLKKLSAVNARLQKGLAAAVDVFSQLDQSSEPDPGQHKIQRAKGHLEFRAVSFSYSEDRDHVLKNVSFLLKPGQTVAIVGQSGSGKSTIAELIPRFYQPDSGVILLDGVPLNEYSLESLRRQLSIVTQQVTLFNDTLRKNIAYGQLEDSDEKDIQAAIRGAHAEEFIQNMPEALDTLVGDNGVLLSGGQRQRIAIARALLKDAPILILDEATSSLDTDSERHIQSALDGLMRNRTTLVIAHRLSTVENADLIIVMQDGKIVESGTHSELIERASVYAGLHKAQFNFEPQEQKPANKTKVRDENDTLVNDTSSLKLATSFTSPLVKAWYSGARWLHLLQPLAAIYRLYVQKKRYAYVTGKKASWRADVPVIVVGNLTVGGTGKTPFVIWLAQLLKEQGYLPGIVARGYGGRSKHYPLRVNALSQPKIVGDESLLLALRTKCPVYVDPDRCRAVKTLLEETNCNIVLSDDGLQHYRLARDVEIAIIDAKRGFGNGLCLPAGPLREPLSRLKLTDLAIANGKGLDKKHSSVQMEVLPTQFVNLADGRCVSTEDFEYGLVHAVAGIGNPDRFFDALTNCNVRFVPRLYRDHHQYLLSDVSFADNLPVIMTEKDAVKVRQLVPPNLEQFWYLEVAVQMSTGSRKQVIDCLRSQGIKLDD